MGMGPWAQGDLVRSIEKAERARWRRAISKLEAKLWHDMELQKSHQHDTRKIVVEALDEMRAAVAPKKKPVRSSV